jgi:DNA-binding GntR family transcriptional regulator
VSEVVDAGAALRIRRTESLTSLVRRELERMIQAGELQGGDRLNENALAAKLGVSRGPVREACRGLEQTGLVEVVVNRGVFVRKLPDAEAAELYDIRAALMRLAGRTLAPRITAGELAHLRQLVEVMDGAARRDDLDAFYPVNIQFHADILRFAGNGRLRATCGAIDREMHLFRRHTLHLPGRMAASNAEHAAIVDALEARDAERAARLMEEHVLVSRRTLFGDRRD